MQPDWLTTLRASPDDRDEAWVVLEGRGMIEAALAGWWEVAGVLIAEEHPWEVPAWSGLEVIRGSRAELGELADPGRHAGVLGLAKRPSETAEVAVFMRALEPDALLVVCPRLTDPALAGMLLRQAAAHGATAVLFGAEGVSPFDPVAISSSEGEVFRLPVRVADGGQLLRSLKAAAVHLIGLEAGHETTALPSSAGRRALVVGDPVNGLGPFWRMACDQRVSGEAEWLLGQLAAGDGV